MINFVGCFVKEIITKHNPNYVQVPDHPYRISIIVDSGFEQTNALLNLINHKLYIANNFYPKDPYTLPMKQNTNF